MAVDRRTTSTGGGDVAEHRDAQLSESVEDASRQEELEDLEAPDAEVKGGGVSGTAGGTDPIDRR